MNTENDTPFEAPIENAQTLSAGDLSSSNVLGLDSSREEIPAFEITNPSQESSQEEQIVLEQTATKLTAPSEGFSSKPYQDSGGIWTYGFGAIRDTSNQPVTKNTVPCSWNEAVAMLERDLRSALHTVEQDVRVPLSAAEEQALLDFVYNVGAGNFQASTLIRKLNAKDYEGASQEFSRWVFVGAAKIQGLALRRAREQAVFDAETE